MDTERRQQLLRRIKRELRTWGIAALLLVTVLSIVGSLTLDYLEHHLHNPQEAAESGQPAPRPRPPVNPLRNAYFGDLHAHSALSLEANVFDVRNGPRAAYRFAKGESFELAGVEGRQKLGAPLDFAAVTDHAEGMGAIRQCYDKSNASYWSLDCMGIRYRIVLVFSQWFSSAQQSGAQLAGYSTSLCGTGGKNCVAAARLAWQEVQAAARAHYEPGHFTTFNGFDYSPNLGRGGSLPRNVIFRGEAVPNNVFSAMDGFAEDLLNWLDGQCKGPCQALTIPHSSNFSWGLMFGETNSDGTPLTAANLALRARYDALAEVVQTKGSAECMAGVGTTDGQCGFENIFPACGAEEAVAHPKTGQHSSRCIASQDMLRNVLKKGLQDTAKWGFNPYKLGLVGGSNGHNGTPGDTQEGNWKGHAGTSDATPEQRLGLQRSLAARFSGIAPAGLNPGGLTGVWAEENTREAIWDALHRKEVFATSGTRVRVRMFAGFDYPANLHTLPDAVQMAYASGVPMGGDLTVAGPGQAPSFLVMAQRDEQSAPLQRIQVVKAWVTGAGAHEKVYDVACADGIQPDVATHQCRDNGATVNLSDCSISPDKGATALAATWRDPDFDPHAPTFYYVRVLENPVCRHSQRDAIRLGLEAPANVPKTIQERAWSSPIWYSAK